MGVYCNCHQTCQVVESWRTPTALWLKEGPLFSVPSNAANGDSLTSGVSEKPVLCALLLRVVVAETISFSTTA